MVKTVRKPRRPSNWVYNNRIGNDLPEGISQQAGKLELEIENALEATPDSGFVAGSENHEKIVEKYNDFEKDFNKKAEEYALAITDSLRRNIASRSNFGFPRAYCVAGFIATDRQVMEKNPELIDFKSPITEAGADRASERMAQVFGNNGFSENLYESLKTKIAENPTLPQVFSVQRSSRYSNSGLHYVTVAPKVVDGKIVRDESGNVKYSVYSFNKNSVTDFDTNDSLKTTGHFYNITQLAYVKEQERFYNDVILPLAQQNQTTKPEEQTKKTENPKKEEKTYPSLLIKTLTLGQRDHW